MRRKGRETYRGPEGAEGKGLRSPTRWRAVQQRVPDGDRGGPWRTGTHSAGPVSRSLCLHPALSPSRVLLGPRFCLSPPLGLLLAAARCGCLRPFAVPLNWARAACWLAGSLALTRDLGLSWDHAPSRFRPAWLSIFLPFLLFISLIQSVRL